MAIPRWEQIDVTSSRRPILQPSEEVIYVQSDVGLYSGKHKVAEHQGGTVYLTGQRICYVDSLQPALKSIALDLQYIARIDHTASFLKSSAKVSIRYTDDSSSESASGRSTPLDAALVAPKQKLSRDWICSICTFTNNVPATYVDGSPLPPCVNCGMKPKKNIKISTHSNGILPSAVKSELPQIARRSADMLIAQQPSDGVKQAAFRCPRCTFENHPAITTCEVCGAPLLSRNLPPVLQSNANTDERNTGLYAGGSSSTAIDRPSCKLSFRAGGDKTFLDKLRRALADRAWEREITQPLQKLSLETEVVTASRGAGISALQSREEDLRTKDANVMSGAFEDLDGLMLRAKEMVALAESFAKRMTAAPTSAGTSDAKQLILESSAMLGLTSPAVTKDFVGKSGDYHAELARQIVDYLESGRLREEGGAITLADLYAIYNRARKGSFVAPDDLFEACQQFDRLKLPVVLRRFQSGIVVVQDRSRNDISTRRLVLNWLKDRTLGASAGDAAERFGWSVGVAREELEMVEQSGDIVRDMGVQGLRFYENKITAWDYTSWYATQSEPNKLEDDI